jgi:hypothetical protein
VIPFDSLPTDSPPGGLVEHYRTLAGLLVGRAPPQPLDGEEEWRPLVALAQQESVGALLAHCLRAYALPPPPPAAAARLNRTYREAVARYLLHRSVREKICRRLVARAIPVMLLKGMALADGWYDDPATRIMQDLDLLVPPSRLAEAASCLEECGFQFRPPPPSLLPWMNRPRIHRVYLHPASSAVIELHWELKALTRAGEGAVGELWVLAQPSHYRDDTWRLGIAPMLPLLSAHMTLQHQEASLLWLFDLHRLLLRIDAEEAGRAVEAASRWRLAPCTARALLRVHDLFGTPMPEDLLSWARGEAVRDTLQGRLALLALTPGSTPRPHRGLVNLVVSGDWGLLRSLFPAPNTVREQFQAAPEQSLLIAYLRLFARRIDRAPADLRLLWNSLKRLQR